jgi:hypothetical protein
MKQAYWLDPIRSGELLRSVLHTFVGAGSVAIEGEAQALGALPHSPVREVGPARPSNGSTKQTAQS